MAEGSPREGGARRALAAFALAAPALAVVAVATATGVDAPFEDDFDALLDFANRYVGASGAAAKLALLLEPHVDHRLLVPRLGAVALLDLVGRLDFRLLAALGVAALLALALLVALLRRDDAAPGNAVALAPAAWLLLAPQSYDALLSPTMGANVVVLALAALALHGLRRGGAVGLAGAIAAALAAEFTQGNGVLVLPAGLVAVALAVSGSRGPGASVHALPATRRTLWTWLAASTALGLLYLASYAGASGAAGLRPAHWARTAGYALALLGSAAGFGHVGASLAIGLAVVGFLAFSLARGGLRASPGCTGLLAFALLSIAANAVARSALGVTYAVSQPRYRVYSALVLALCHLRAVDLTRGGHPASRYRAMALGVGVAVGLSAFVVYTPRAFALAAASARGLARWSVTGEGLAHRRPLRASAVLQRSLELGTFAIDPASLDRFLDQPLPLALPAPSSAGEGARVTLSRGNDAFQVIEIRFGGQRPRATRAFAVVEDSDGALAFRTHPMGRGRRPGPARDADRFSVVPRALFPAQPRALGVLVVEGDRRTYARRPVAPGGTGPTPRGGADRRASGGGS